MLEGDLKDHNIRLYVGLPMYGGLCSEATLHGLLKMQTWCLSNNVELTIQTMGNESLITRARNTLVTMMMDRTDYIATHFLFIDADIGFTPINIERLIRADKDVVCGIYPRKCIHWDKTIKAVKKNPDISEDELHIRSLGYNLNIDDNENIELINGYCKVNEAATGMMLVKREVFKTMQKKFPERKYSSDQIINGKMFKSNNCYDFFPVGVYETAGLKRYLSEDYYFSRLWQECGGEIWADVSQPLSHFGNFGFQGHTGSIFEKKE